MKNDHKDEHKYDDIINLEHHVSNHRKHMSIKDRAAQFSPFAALTGFDVAIKEAARITDQKIELDEMEKSKLDEKLRIVQNQLGGQEEVEVEFFQADELKEGGAYVTLRGSVKNIDAYERIVVMQDGTRIEIEAIIDLRGAMFQMLDDFFA